MSPTMAVKTQNIYSYMHVGPHHNGGSIYFSPKDGGKPLLYHSVGNDEDKEGAGASAKADGRQGRVMRYDVSTKMPVPAEGMMGWTFSYGMRNPYRFSIDRLTGDIWIGDIENGPGGAVYFNPSGMGKNWGYGNSGSDLKSGMAITGDQTSDKALIGGVVYRGSKIKGLCGRYFYAMWPGGPIKSLIQKGGMASGQTTHADIGPVNDISSFGEDGDGEIIMSSNKGQVWRIVAGP
jgi:glucose/arabinose dehydrogenase